MTSLREQYNELVLTGKERADFIDRLESEGRRGKPATKEEIAWKRLRLSEFRDAVKSFKRWMEAEQCSSE